MLTCLAALPATAAAQSQSFDIRPNAELLGSAELEAAVSGNTLSGAYNFTRDGEAQSFFTEHHGADGTVAYDEGELSSSGRWTVLGELICYRYDHGALDGGCFRLYRVENCLYFYSDQIPRRSDEIERDYWTARATVGDEAARCEASFV